jgi:hypothetical protein
LTESNRPIKRRGTRLYRRDATRGILSAPIVTELEQFECPNCGAKVERPEPGKSTECPYCNAELTAPEAPAPKVVREVVVERVIERAEPVPDFHRAPSASRRTRLVIFAAAVVAGGLVIAMILTNAQQDSDALDAKFKARDDCEATCKQGCERQYAAPKAAPQGASDPTDLQLKEIQRESDKTMCESDCTMRCR